MNDQELARRSLRGFGEMFAALGRAAEGHTAVVRRSNALGARLDSARYNPFFSSAVVPLDQPPPEDNAELPHYIWSVAEATPGRIAEPKSDIPCMGLDLHLADLQVKNDDLEIKTPSWTVLGDINERAYGESGFTPLVAKLNDPRMAAHGLCEGARFVCVAMTLTVDEDVSIHYVATEEERRGRGLASKLVRALLARAKTNGATSASLQASAMGLSVWQNLGFKTVATVRGFIRA